MEQQLMNLLPTIQDSTGRKCQTSTWNHKIPIIINKRGDCYGTAVISFSWMLLPWPYHKLANLDNQIFIIIFGGVPTKWNNDFPWTLGRGLKCRNPALLHWWIKAVTNVNSPRKEECRQQNVCLPQLTTNHLLKKTWTVNKLIPVW